MRSRTVLVFVLVFVLGAGAMPRAEIDATHDWPRFGFDAAGTNASTAVAGISAGDLKSLRRQDVALPGIVDASPIYLHGVTILGATHDAFFVTTTYGTTVAIDADSGTILWSHVPKGSESWAGTAQITTATPVADPDRAFIYAANPGGSIEKLAVRDGSAAWSTAVTLLPQREKIASALNFARGHVIVATGGYIGDASPYQGHIAIIDGASGRLLSVWNSLCSDRAGLIVPRSCNESGSAIWGRAGVVVDTATGNLFVATGNGRWDGITNWGDAVIELDAGASRRLGSYTPENTDDLDSFDQDVGSTSPVLLGGFVAQGGKEGKFMLIDWQRARAGRARRGGEVQQVSTPSGRGLFTAPAVWSHDGVTWIFAADRGATAAWTFKDSRLVPAWKNDHAGTSPVVAGGLLYVYDPGGQLRVYQPESGAELATLECGSGHWNSPIIADGRIALPLGSSRGDGGGGMVVWRGR